MVDIKPKLKRERFELTTALKSDVPLTAELKRGVEKLIRGEKSLILTWWLNDHFFNPKEEKMTRDA